MSKQRNKTKKDRPKYDKKKKKTVRLQRLKEFFSLFSSTSSASWASFLFFFFSSFTFFCQKSPESVVASFLFFTNSLSINSIFFLGLIVVRHRVIRSIFIILSSCNIQQDEFNVK